MAKELPARNAKKQKKPFPWGKALCFLLLIGGYFALYKLIMPFFPWIMYINSGAAALLLVTAAAGIGGTGLGGGLACLFRRDSSRTVSLLLSFAAGVMVAVVCFDLLTDAVAAGEVLQAAMWVLAGYGVTAALNFLLERYRGG